MTISLLPITLLFLLLTSTSTIAFLSRHNNATDRHALISFKSMISSDPSGSLASWNNSIHFCRWLGVTCGGRLHPQRVISLNLTSLQLTGSISPAIANLSFLKKIDLSSNQFRGPIPGEIGQLPRLQRLNFSGNSIEGGIPATLSHCSKLEVISLWNNLLRDEIPPSLYNCTNLRLIDLGSNSQTGRIPPSVTNISSLLFLSLYKNQLRGDIPSSIGNLHSLVYLDLSENQLLGSIPPSLGKLFELSTLYLSINNLTGRIPALVWNLSSLVILDLSFNSLSGSLPPNAGQALPLLENIYLSRNKLHGPIPVSFSNASHLSHIQFPINEFSGTIPAELGSLQNLQRLILGRNRLESREPDGLNFLSSLVNCTKLEWLDLAFNKLKGTLPNSIANLSTNLYWLTLGNNNLNGNIPSDIGNLASLALLDLGPNLLSGSIPNSIGRLQNLNVLDLYGNKLSGKIPSTIGNLSQLNQLFLGLNELSGSIPANLGNCQRLILLSLGENKLTCSIPKEIFRISALDLSLDLSQNSLTGSLPSEVGMLSNSAEIDFSFNKLSGQLPSTLGDCVLLQRLYLSENFFHGSIPFSLASLRGIEELDVSKNRLSGQIPDFLQTIQGLKYLNLSFNNFEGEVPRFGVFENTSAFSFVGNNNLCGGNPSLHLPPCPYRSTKKNHQSHKFLIILIAATSILSIFFCFLGACWWIKKSRTPLESSLIKKQHAKLSYAELMKATNGFSRANLIGMGSFGTVYKGMLDDDGGILQVVAVKVLNLQLQRASKSFIAECEALRNVRHRNLLRIITVCSSIDFQGNDFKAVVSEFMDNGSLDDWLHPEENHQLEQKNLSLIQRLNIAIDVANALEYLQCHCETPIVHCDLKPSNVLLDSDKTAHVGDFGLSKILEETISKSTLGSISSSGLKGTVGYVAPEYGLLNRVSVQGDIYSYGILLLEMFTAKRPTDEMFKEDFSLRKFVESFFPNSIMDSLDARLLLKEDGQGNDDVHKTMECVASIFKVGIKCSSELPADRMKMGEVIVELHKVRNAFTRNASA